MNSRTNWWALCFPIGVLLMLIGANAGAQTTRPSTTSSDALDSGTQEMLNAINAGKAPPPATAPAESGSDENEMPAGPIPWRRLIVNFDAMLITAGALGIAGSVLGLFVLLRREALVALAIPQVVAVGAAIGMRFGWPTTLPPALGLAIVALVYFALSKRWAASNWVIPSAYIAGLSLSFLIIANHGQGVEDLQHMFVGVDVAVSWEKAAVSVPVLLAVAIGCGLLWRRWLLLAQAPAAAELAGLKPSRWDTLFLALLTTVILLGTYSLTVVMVLAMLFLPAATVLPWARRLPVAMVAAASFALAFVAIGFYLSNTMNWPMSQSIGGTGFVALALSHLASKFVR